MKRSEERKPEILMEDEVKKMIEAAPKIRDKAFIAVAYEAGFRIGKMLNIRLGAVSPDRLKYDLNIGKNPGDVIGMSSAGFSA